MINKKYILRVPASCARTLIPLIVTMALGIVNMLDISESVRMFAGVIFLATMLFLPPTESIKYLMFILCANELLNIGTTSLTMIFVALFTAKECLFSITTLKINLSIFGSWLALILVGIVAYVVGGEGVALVTTVKHIFFLYYAAKVLEASRGAWKKLYIQVFQHIAFGVIFFTILSIATNGMPSLSVRFTPSSEITINFFGIVCALVIVNLLYSILLLKASAAKNIYLMIACGISGLLTQSRSFILAIAVGIVLLLLFTSSLRKKFVFIIVGLLSALALWIVYEVVPSFANLADAALSRILDPLNGDLSNGRYILWSSTISSMLENPIYFWLGAGDYSNIGAMFDNKIMVAHNMFLEMWVIYGVLGCLFVLLVYIFYFKHYLFNFVQRKIRAVTMVPLIVMLCSLFFSHHFIGRSMSIVFSFSFLPIVMDSAN